MRGVQEAVLDVLLVLLDGVRASEKTQRLTRQSPLLFRTDRLEGRERKTTGLDGDHSGHFELRSKLEGLQKDSRRVKRREETKKGMKQRRNERTQLMQAGLKMYDRQQSGRDKLQAERGDEEKIEGNALSRMLEVTGAEVENKENTA